MVAGEIRRAPDGTLITNEMSGHFGVNWTDALRKQFVDFMKSLGEKHSHWEWEGN
ncbi:MAG: hypothetical protein K2R98_24825 [Gemmataceae bacterium]|nr:hypothetical protein [Gemmataceae bacterium]